MQAHDKGKMKATEDPKDWTVEDVVGWLKTKGFGQDICDKFTGVCR